MHAGIRRSQASSLVSAAHNRINGIYRRRGQRTRTPRPCQTRRRTAPTQPLERVAIGNAITSRPSNRCNPRHINQGARQMLDLKIDLALNPMPVAAQHWLDATVATAAGRSGVPVHLTDGSRTAANAGRATAYPGGQAVTAVPIESKRPHSSSTYASRAGPIRGKPDSAAPELLTTGYPEADPTGYQHAEIYRSFGRPPNP